MNADLLPPLDPTPIPGPPWLFHGLLVLTFFLHVLFLDFALGGTVLAALASLRGRDPAGVRPLLVRRLVALNTYAISLAITTGVAPLLFVQVLYPQTFYTATILVGEAWIAFLVLLLIGYYAVWAWKEGAARSDGNGSPAWLAVAAVCFLGIAATHVAVHLAHVRPGAWETIARGARAAVADAAYVPRLLHFVVPAIGWSALAMAWWAARRARAGDDPERNAAVSRSAWPWVLWTTVLQVLGGFAVLLTLPGEVLRGLMRGGVSTLGPLAVAIALGVVLIVAIARIADPAARPGAVGGVFATMVATVAAMAITRHQVRTLYLEPVAAASAPASAPQWGAFVMFAVLLVVALATVAWMARVARTARA